MLNWEEIRLVNELKNRKSQYTAQMDRLQMYAFDMLPKINRVFGNYTEHNTQHAFRVMENIYDLINNVDSLSELEILVLIYVSFLHDIGMVVTDEEIEKIKKDELIYLQRKYSKAKEMLGDETLALQEIIRPVHGFRSYEHIIGMNSEYFMVKYCTNCSFQEEVGRICQAHNENFTWITVNLGQEIIKNSETFHAQYVSLLLRIADYLDIDESRTPTYLYNLLMPKGMGDLEWRQHYIVENWKKIFIREDGLREVRFCGRCSSPALYRKIKEYLSDVQSEIQRCIATSAQFDEKHRISLWPEIVNKIFTEGFTVSDLTFKVDYKIISQYILGEKLYGNKRHGLRELLQNAVDACQVMKDESDKLTIFKYTPYAAKIDLIIDFTENQFIIQDNGIGMTEEVLEQYFLNIGKSYYRSNAFQLQGRGYKPIGAFGIGFLACFMLSNEVCVESKSFKEGESGFFIELESGTPYICRKTLNGLIQYSGTAIVLKLDSVMSAFGVTNEDIETFVKQINEFLGRTFLNMDIEIEVICLTAESRDNYIVNLPKWEDTVQQKATLDCSLENVSVGIELDCSQIKVDSCLEDMCINGIRSNEICEFMEEQGRLVRGTVNGISLKKYISGTELMVAKFTGIKEESRENISKLQELTSRNSNYSLLCEFESEICLPIRFNREWLAGADSTHMWGTSAMRWHSPLTQNVGKMLSSLTKGETLYTVEEFCKDVGFCIDHPIQLEIGVINILEIAEGVYIEVNDTYNFGQSDEMSLVYLHNVLLEKASIYIKKQLIGLNIGTYIINISDSNVKPNIARDNLSDEDQLKISNLVEKAIYKWVRDHVTDYRICECINSMLEKDFPE